MKKVLSLTTACAVFFASLVSPQIAQAQEDSSQATISQGEKVYINETAIACTVGYVDKNTHKAYIADHCLPAHQKSVIYNSNREKIGEAYGRFSDRKMGIAKSRNDVAYINLYDNVQVGENSRSGDARVSTKDISIGEELCMFSRKYGSVHCGHVKSVDGTLVVGDEHVNGIGGDSGGPAWIPGKGFVGVYTLIIGGKHFFTSIDDKNCAEGDGSINEDGTVDDSKMCPAGQYAEHSPYVLGKTPLKNPDNENKVPEPDISDQDNDTEMTPTPATHKPSTPTPPKTGGFSGSSSGSEWLLGFAAIAGVAVILTPFIMSILSGKTPHLNA